MIRQMTAQDRLVPLYHPTAVVLVDEDAAFLHATTMRLQGAFQCFSFRRLEDAIAHIEASARAFQGADAADAVTPPGLMEHVRDPAERALHLKASRLPRVFSDAARFAKTSVIVTGDTGGGAASLAALERMRAAPVRKLALLGANADGFAARAVTEGLADAVCARAPSDFYKSLTEHLRTLQLEFFRLLTRPIEPALSQSDARFLADAHVQAAFRAFVIQHDIIEHCACLHPPGILGLDAAGNPVLMIVVDDDYRRASFEIAHAEGAPTELLRRLAHGDAIAVFPTRSGFYANGLGVDWRECLWTCRKLGDGGWYSAIIEEPDVARIVCGVITSYNSYRHRRLS
jgi:hypothetical protein